MKIFRKRTTFIWVLPFLVLAWLYWRDPDAGATTEMWVLRLVSASCYIALAHWWEKGIFDYYHADRERLFEQAARTSSGAGLALIARALFFLAIVLCFTRAGGAEVDARIPDRALQYLPQLQAVQAKHWPETPQREWLAALVEHESGCFALKGKCWNPLSQLKSSREEGAGLGQITRAYRKDGTLRFDALAEMRDRHPALREISWENVYQRPDLQLAAVVLKMRENWLFFTRFVPDPMEALLFADAGYNGGNGGVQHDRRKCAASPGCDPKRWFGHVERHCTKSTEPIYGRRSACDINRHHVVDVGARAPKYQPLLSRLRLSTSLTTRSF